MQGFFIMKKFWWIAFILSIAMIIVMRWQGSALITPVSPRGIIDLEFARDAATLEQLKLFWNPRDLSNHIYLDFIFIFAYTWFLAAASSNLSDKTGWKKYGKWSVSLALGAGFFDILENFMMIMVYQERFSPSLLQVVFFVAMLKFIMAALSLLYIVASLPGILIKNKKK